MSKFKFLIIFTLLCHQGQLWNASEPEPTPTPTKPKTIEKGFFNFWNRQSKCVKGAIIGTCLLCLAAILAVVLKRPTFNNPPAAHQPQQQNVVPEPQEKRRKKCICLSAKPRLKEWLEKHTEYKIRDNNMFYEEESQNIPGFSQKIKELKIVWRLSEFNILGESIGWDGTLDRDAEQKPEEPEWFGTLTPPEPEEIDCPD